VPVLVPGESRLLFERDSSVALQPAFYRLRNESPGRKVLRRLGVISPANILNWRLKLIDAEKLHPETRALWLSPNHYLPPSQMASLIDRLPRLKWVYSQVTGTDHLDLEDFAKRGIMLSNTGDLSSRRVAEMVLACVLSHAKRLPEHSALQRRRRWRSLPCSELQQQTIGILGTGNIGHEVGRLCRALGARVVGASRDPRRFETTPHPYHEVAPLGGDMGALLAGCDHVVICLPATDSTRGLIDAKALGRMKSDASLINVSRGEVVNEKDLCDALSKGHIGAAYVDRTKDLPPSRWSRLYRTPNLHLTHNSSASSRDTLGDAYEQFVVGVTAILDDEEPPNRVA
jgi:phosphoglycerate dehydrogenase-like enzyme